MEIKDNMQTLSQAIESMRVKGYDKNFELADKGFRCKETDNIYEPEDLTIVKVFRFEGDSNPSDMSALYAIESGDSVKGLFVEPFGTYANNDQKRLSDLLKRMKIIKEH